MMDKVYKLRCCDNGDLDEKHDCLKSQPKSMPTQNWREEFAEKLKNYTQDGGFVIYTNDELDVDLIDSFFTSKLKGIREEIDKEAKSNDDYSAGLWLASSILTRWIEK